MNIGKERIQTGKEAQFRKMPLQQLVLKKLIDMYRYRLFLLELNIERPEILRKRKIKHTHGLNVSMLYVVIEDSPHLSNSVVANGNKFPLYLFVRGQVILEQL